MTNLVTASKAVSFINKQGIRLKGILEQPLIGSKTYAIYAHCFTCTKSSLAAVRVSKALAQKGINVLRFDFAGLGQSEGNFSDSNFSSNLDDLVAAFQFLSQAFYPPQILIGHSLGGAAVLAALDQLPDIKAVVTIGAPAYADHVTHNFHDKISEIEQQGRAQVFLGGRELTLTKQFIDDLAQYHCLDRLAKTKAAPLICHSPVDSIVSIEHAELIFKAAKHPKSFVSLGNADHLVTQQKDAEFLADMITAWSMRWVSVESKSPAMDAQNQVIINESHQSQFQQIIDWQGQQFIADEPVESGGKNTGPGPYDYLLMALGACTSMTLRLYANHKQIPLQHVSVKLNHKKEHIRDCEDFENKNKVLDHIFKQLEISGPLTEEQLERLEEIAERCPVHRTLLGEIIITSELLRKED
ncbi:alpha/beta superfamily hydrolase [Legionella birminghamensis]|uniref:Alpha/beta superfamily hydrolase n=1 Tax=Legionella birminghamensis TaxID=28083 RepID=A0A378I7K7_9GAMM|nr:alpha/beta fold hydrolase [Legionella birminghamensis]KTC72479.1 alpha/beta superfamily hydrolase [Legionella birminghamensis]STX30611.1 alpha/beta superfamily hydrolase [Legionella birminghamensis]